MLALVTKTLVLILIILLYNTVYKEWKKTANFPPKKISGSEPKQQTSITAPEQAVSKELTATLIFQSTSSYHDTSEIVAVFDRSTRGVSRRATPTLIFQPKRTETLYRKIRYLCINEKQRRRTLLKRLKLLSKGRGWQQALFAPRNSNRVLSTLRASFLTVLALVYGFMLIEMVGATYLLGNAISFFYRIVDGDIFEQGQFTATIESKWFALLAVGPLNMKRRRTKKQGVRKDLKRRIRMALTYQKDKPARGTGWAEQRLWAREKRRISWGRSKSLNESGFEHLQKVPALTVSKIPSSPFRAQCVRYRRKKRLQDEQVNTTSPRVKLIKLERQEAPSFIIANRYLPTSRGTSVRQEAIQALLQDPGAEAQEEESTEETAVKKERFARLYRDADRVANANGTDAVIRLVGDISEYLDTTAERRGVVLPHQMAVEVSNKAHTVVKRVQNRRTRQRIALRKTALRLLSNIGPIAQYSLQSARKSRFKPQKVLAYLNKQHEGGVNTDAREIEKVGPTERQAREAFYPTELFNPKGNLDLHKLKTAIGRSTFEYRTKVRMLKDRQTSVYEHMKARMHILMRNSSRRSPLRVSTRRHSTRIRLRQEYARVLSILLQTTRKRAHATHQLEYKRYMRRAVKRAWLAGYYTELSRLEVELATLLQTLKLKAPKHPHTHMKRHQALVKRNIKNAALALWNRIVALRREPIKIERTGLFENLGIKLLARTGQSLGSSITNDAKRAKQPRANLYKFAYKSVKAVLKKKLATTLHLRVRGEGFTRKLFHFLSDRQQALRAVPVLSNRWPRRTSFLKMHAVQILKHSHALLTKTIVTAQAKLIAEQIYRGFALHGYEEKSPLRVQLPSQEAFYGLPRHSRGAMLANLRCYKLSALLLNANTLNTWARSNGLSELSSLQAHPLAQTHQKRKGYLLSDWKQKYRIKRALTGSRLARRKPFKASRYVDPDRFVKHVLKYVEQRSVLYRNKNLNAGVVSNVSKAERPLVQQTGVTKLKKMKRWALSRVQRIKQRAEKLMLLVKARQSTDNRIRQYLNVRHRRAYNRPMSRQSALKLVALRCALAQERTKIRSSRKLPSWKWATSRRQRSWAQKQKQQQRKQGCDEHKTTRTAVRTDKKKSQVVARWQRWKGRLKRDQGASTVKRMRMKNKLQNFLKKQTYLVKHTSTFVIKKTPISGLIFSARRTKARRRSIVRYHTAVSRESQSKLHRRLTSTRRKARSRVIREKQKAILAVRRALYLSAGRRRKKERYVKNRKPENRQWVSLPGIKRYLHMRIKNLWKRGALAIRSRLARKGCTRGGARLGYRDKRPVRYSRLGTRVKPYVQNTNSNPTQHRQYNSLQHRTYTRFYSGRKNGHFRKKPRPSGWHRRMRREVRTKYKRWLKSLQRYDHTKFVQWVKLPAFVEELHGSFGVESYYGLTLTRLKMLKRWKLARNRLFFRRRSRRFSEVQQRDFAIIEEAERTETKSALKELKEIDDYMSSQGELRMKKEVFGLVDDDILPANMEERISISDRLNHGFIVAEEKLAQLRLQRTKVITGFSRLQSLRRTISPSTRLRLNARALAESTVALEDATAAAVSLQNTAMQSSSKSSQLVGGETENVIATVAVRQRFSTGRAGVGRLLERMQFARSELAMQRWLLIQKVLYADNDLLHVNRTFPHIAATVTTPAVTNLSTYQQEGQLVHREL